MGHYLCEVNCHATAADFSNILIFLFYVLKKRGYYYRLIAQKSGLKGLKGGFNG